MGQTNELASRFVTAGDVCRGSKSALVAPPWDMALACHQAVGGIRARMSRVSGATLEDLGRWCYRSSVLDLHLQP